MAASTHAQTTAPSPLDDIGKTMDRYATTASKPSPAPTSSVSLVGKPELVRERMKKAVAKPAPVVAAPSVARHVPAIDRAARSAETVRSPPVPAAVATPLAAPASGIEAVADTPEAMIATMPGMPWYLNHWIWIGGGIATLLLLIEILGRRQNHRSRRGL